MPLATIPVVTSAIFAILSELSDTILILSDKASICLKQCSESSACWTTPCSIASIEAVISCVSANSCFALSETVDTEVSTRSDTVFVFSISCFTLSIMPLVLAASLPNSSLLLTSICTVKSPPAASSSLSIIFLIVRLNE